MAIPKNDIILHGLSDCAIKSITDDTSGGITLGTLIDIPGIQELTITPRVFSSELKADEVVKDVYSRVEAAEFSVTNAQMSMDALAALMGGKVAAGGAAGAETQTLTVDNSGLAGYFKLEGKVDYAKSQSTGSAVSDAHFVLFKCKITGNLSFTLTQDGYANVSFSGLAIGTIYDNKIFDIVFNETPTDIA